MKDYVYYNDLFVIYAPLLTQNERDTFKDYYQEDLSLTEISENKSISRAAVQKTVKNVIDKLNYYENTLGKYKILNTVKKAASLDDIDAIKEELNQIIEG